MAEHDLRDALIVGGDLSGAVVRNSNVARLRIVNSYLDDVRLSGYLGNVVVNDVDVTAFVRAELDRLHPMRVVLREARTLDDLRSIWDGIEDVWAAATERAQRLPESARQDRVDGEWSFVETMRHLIFAADAWVSRTILAEPMPYHRLGIPHSEYPAADCAAIGLEPDAQPSFKLVAAIRADRMATIRGVLDSLTDDDLDRMCTQAPTPDFPDERHTVRQCLRTVMNEECEHHRYATRDLAVLESRAQAAWVTSTIDGGRVRSR